ncbi:hypothetical protein DF048_30570 [Burkholderia seminalis]|nr:hypothetical protein DF032_15910 [Burkholderia seminalis]RQS86640.1 hypothetical protein DF048_30570 [Burkholderia seminalis]
MSSPAGCTRCRTGFRPSAERRAPRPSPGRTGINRSNCDSRYRFDFHAVATANFAWPAHTAGNAFRLLTVTKNCLSGGIRITYIAIHLDTFVACPDRPSRRVDLPGTPDKQ